MMRNLWFSLAIVLITGAVYADDQIVDFTNDSLVILNSNMRRLREDVDRAPRVYTGTAAPTKAPYHVGDMWIDSTNHKVYIADGNDTSTNWRILN